MRITRKLKLSAWVPVLMAFIIGLALLFSYRTMQASLAEVKTARQIMQGMAELNSFALYYMINQDDRPRKQFLIAHNSVTERIAAMAFENAEKQEVLESIRRHNNSLRNAFLKLTAVYDGSDLLSNPSLLKEAEERLTGRMLIKSRDVLADASRLASLIHSDITRAQRNISVLIFLLLTAVTFPLTNALIRMVRNINSSLAALGRGTQIIAAGNLNHRIDLATQDEIGELSRAFDSMTEKLRATTVSVDELTQEVEEHKRTQAALRESRQRWAVTLDSIGDGVIATDTEGRITFVNKVAETLTGWRLAEANGKPVQSVIRIVNEHTRTSIDLVGEVLRNGKIIELGGNHMVLLHRDGKEIPIDDSAAPIRNEKGSILGAVLIFRDISERRKTEQALRQNERRLSLAISATADAIWEWNVVTQETYYSPRWYEMMGYGDREIPMTFEAWKNMCHPDDYQPTMELIRSSLQSPDDSAVAAEFRMQAKDGAWMWILGRGRVVQRDAAGKPVLLSGTISDITERKHAEEELNQLNETLEQRVAERTALAETRAKQLQTLAVELVGAEEKERRRIAQILHDDMQQLLAAGRMQLQTAFEQLPSNPLLANVDHLLKEAIFKSRRLSHELSPPVLHHSGLIAALEWLFRQMDEQFGLKVRLKAEGSQLEDPPLKVFLFRAVQELLFNIVKHAGVKTARVFLSRFNGGIEVTVTDQGRGVDPDIMETSNVKAGLGLVSLRERARSIGGDLVIESAPGQGSRFTLSVPVRLSETQKAHPPENANGRQLRQPENLIEDCDTAGIRVLFADDHKVMRQGLIQLIAGQPDIQTVGEAADGQQALEMVRQTRPDVVVMDVSMPVMDGVEATRRITAEFPEIRVIALSMFENDQIARTMHNAGAEIFMSKTASSAELLKAIYGMHPAGGETKATDD